VSTNKQGKSALGMDAPREAIQRHLNGGNSKLLGEYVEVESGKQDDRPQTRESTVSLQADRGKR
jgi:hypothetical protein